MCVRMCGMREGEKRWGSFSGILYLQSYGEHEYFMLLLCVSVCVSLCVGACMCLGDSEFESEG